LEESIRAYRVQAGGYRTKELKVSALKLIKDQVKGFRGGGRKKASSIITKR